MCIAIPMKVLTADTFSAVCETGGGPREVNTELVGPVSPGDWLLVFRNTAQRTMDEEEARMTLSALTALADVLSGDATRSEVDAAFADITARTGELPPHLRKSASKAGGGN